MDYFIKCLEPVKKVLRCCRLSKSSVDEVVLVGGSTRIPKIRELLSKFFNGKALDTSFHVDETVVTGATFRAVILSGLSDMHRMDYYWLQDILPLDVTSHTIGVYLAGKWSPILPCYTTIPAKKSDTFRIYTSNKQILRDYQTDEGCFTEFEIEIFEGNDITTCQTIYKPKISNIPITESNKVLIVDVTLDIDAHSNLQVEVVVNTGDGVKYTRTFDVTASLSNFVEDDKEMWQQVELEFVRKRKLLHKLTDAICTVNEKLTEVKDSVGLRELKKLITWIETESDNVSYDTLAQKVDQVYSQFKDMIDMSDVRKTEMHIFEPFDQLPSSPTSQLFGLVIPGRPIITEFQLINATRAMTLIENPATISEITFFLMLTTAIPLGHGVVLYYATPPPLNNWVLIGTVDPHKPSGIFCTGWSANPELSRCPAIQLWVVLEP
jgi:molecular chaperone DnaK (HSP70)